MARQNAMAGALPTICSTIRKHILAASLFIVLFLSTLFAVSACRPTVPPSAGDNAKTVTILGQFSAEEQPKFEAALQPFEEKTGIEVIYESTDNFNSLLRMRIASFNKPDVVLLPQPGLMADLLKDDLLVPLSEVMDTLSLRAAYSDAWLDLGSVDDEIYGLWYRASVQSLVWYRPSAFEAKGYEVPDSWPDLMALSEQIVADGGTPWCIGLESGAASGWPGTDWIEDILLRTAGPEVYSQWINHQIPFNSPPVINAFNEFGKVLRNPKYVSGGTGKAIATSYQDAPLGLFDRPPTCYLHRQGSAISSFFPAGKTPRVDYDIFLLPSIDERFGTPLLVAGEALVMFNQTPESAALMQYFASPTPHEIWAGLGGFISPHKQVPITAYPDAVTKNIAQTLAEADVIRFDGSALMPGYVGTDIFWGGIMDFAKGKSAEEVTQEIDNNWP